MKKKIEIERVKEYKGYDWQTDTSITHWNIFVSNEAGVFKRIPFDNQDELDRFINTGEYTERVKEWLDALYGLFHEDEAKTVIYVITDKQA